MAYVECVTKKELETALKNGDVPVLRSGVWEIYGSATVTAFDSATVTATPYVAVHKLSEGCKVNGGVIIVPPKQDTAKRWLDFYGITVQRGTVTLFKAVDDNFTSGYGWSYSPGSKPSAPDFEATNKCGNGLHLGPTPFHSRRYFPGATRFIACTVKVSHIIPITDSAGFSDKVKVSRISKCVEVDIDGRQL